MTRISPIHIIGLLAIVLSLGNSILAVVHAIYLTIGHQRLHILALTAAITQAVLTCSLSHLLIKYTRRARRDRVHRGRKHIERQNLFILLLGIVPSMVAGLVMGATLGWSKASDDQEPRHILGLKSKLFLLIAIGIWLSAVLSQIVFYICLVRTGISKRAPGPSHPTDEPQALQEMAEPIRPETSTAGQSRELKDLPISTSSPPSVAASEESSSLHSSFSIVQRPTNSKTRLLMRQHSFPRPIIRSTDSPSQERGSEDSGFDSWDTSEVAPHIRETVFQSSPIVRGKPLKPLEPIPGSRSPSPAKALEGPFFSRTESLSPPPSPLPQPGISRPASRQRSVSSEDHIHPLFRTCSPTPPPTASSGTTLTAAPLAGQLINSNVLQRMRSGSLPCSTSPLVRSNSFDQFGARASTVLPSQEYHPSMPQLKLADTNPSYPPVPHQPKSKWVD